MAMATDAPHMASNPQRSDHNASNSSREAGGPPSSRVLWSPQAVRRLVLGVMLVLVLQYALVGIVGAVLREPWPTLVLPAFQNVWDGDTELAVPRARLVAVTDDSTRLEVSIDDIWGTVPASQRAGFLREQCRPRSLSGTPRTERCTTPEARAWMHAQLQERYPAYRITRIEVVWEDVLFDVHRPATVQSPRTRPADTLRVPL